MLVVGCLLAGGGVLLAGLLALLFRNPRAPRWAQAELVAFLATVPVACMIGFGLGYVAFGMNALLNGGGDLVRGLGALVGVPVVVALIWHVVGIRARLRAYAAAERG